MLLKASVQCHSALWHGTVRFSFTLARKRNGKEGARGPISHSVTTFLWHSLLPLGHLLNLSAAPYSVTGRQPCPWHMALWDPRSRPQPYPNNLCLSRQLLPAPLTFPPMKKSATKSQMSSEYRSKGLVHLQMFIFFIYFFLFSFHCLFHRRFPLVQTQTSLES